MLVDGLFYNMAFLRTENQLRLGHSHLVVGFFGCVWRHPLSGFLDPASFVSWQPGTVCGPGQEICQYSVHLLPASTLRWLDDYRFISSAVPNPSLALQASMVE